MLFVTALKDGYEDLKRHQSDRAINNIKVSLSDKVEVGLPIPVRAKLTRIGPYFLFVTGPRFAWNIPQP